MDYSFQLYNARKLPSLEPVLGRLAALGYRQVEGFAGLYQDAGALAESLKRHGLTMPTAHFSLALLEDTATALETARTLGVRFLYCPAIPKEDRAQDEAKWVELGKRLARLGSAFRKEGFGFGWHNHDFEFRPLPNGKLPMDILLETAPHNEWEIDIAWLVRAGQDPVAWLKRFGGRINAVHVKDIAPAGEAVDEDGWADVGHGTLDWKGLFDVIRTETNAKYFIMEHDNPSDVERFAARSIAAAKSLEG